MALMQAALVGCSGGEGGQAVFGRLKVQIDWPSRSRYVPPYANSVALKLTVTQTGQELLLSVNRGPNDGAHTGVAAFPDPIPAGPHLLEVMAHADQDGAGELVASARMIVNIAARGETSVNVSTDLESTIDAVFIDNAPEQIPAGTQVILTGHAEDASGRLLVLPQGALRWSLSLGTEHASIDAETGLLTANEPGEITVELAEPGVGIADAVDIVIVEPPARFGYVRITVDWPGRSRYVPPYANSVVATIGTETVTINRSGDAPSQGNAIFPNPFPVSGNPYTLVLEAYTQTDGGGTKVATASMQINVVDGETLSLNVTGDLESVIDHIVIDGPFAVHVGYTIQMTGHAEDGENAVIPLPAGALRWSLVSGSEYAAITPDGQLRGIAPGRVRVRLEEPGAGVSGEADVEILSLPPPPPG